MLGRGTAKALAQLKNTDTRAPVLLYYSLKEEVTLQCNPSQSGLGAALFQNGSQVAYASRALTDAKTRYVQIEKELMAIVFACEIFDAYIYGREVTTVETDHKPLQAIIQKPLHAAPQLLQRMLLRLQKYHLNVKHKKGQDMHLSDTLSRALLSEVNTSEFVRELENIDQKPLLRDSDSRWQQIQHASANDPVLQQLRSVIQNGKPPKRSDVSQSLYPYFDIRDELSSPHCPSKKTTPASRARYKTFVQGCSRSLRFKWSNIAGNIRLFPQLH